MAITPSASNTQRTGTTQTGGGGGYGPAYASIYTNPFTLTGTQITSIPNDAAALASRTHCCAKDGQVCVGELWYLRDSVYTLWPYQPYMNDRGHPQLTEKYRDPSTFAFSAPNPFGELTPENLESDYNYNAAGAYDPLADEARKIVWRFGTACYTNYASGIAPTSSLAPAAGTLAALTDGVLSDFSVASPTNYTRFDTSTQTFTLKVNLGAQRKVRHVVIRFGTKTTLPLGLPVSVRVGVSTNDIGYTYYPTRPVGGVGSATDAPGDLGDAYYGLAFEIPFCDLNITGQYVTLDIKTVGVVRVAIDEIAVYGGDSFTMYGANRFVGYLGDQLDFDNDGFFTGVATDGNKRLNDNNDNDVTAAVYQLEAADIMYSLLTGSAYWKAQSAYNTAFSSGEVGWSSGVGLTGFTYPVWQGQANSVLGYEQELSHSIGWCFYQDGNGTWQMFDPPYRQTSPNRIFINDADGNYDVRNVMRHRTGKDMRNTVSVSTGKVSTGTAADYRLFEPNSVKRYGSRKTSIVDPLLSSQDLRRKCAEYFIREYAFRLQTITCDIAPNFDTRIKDVYGIRAVANPKMYAKACTVRGLRRPAELWTLDQIVHHFTPGQWWGECNMIPYFPFATESPVYTSFTSPTASNTLTSTWTASADPLVTGYNVYISNTSEDGPYVLAATGVTSPQSFVTTYAGITIVGGNRYWSYITAINQDGFESVPSQILNIIANSNVSGGTDCDASGSGSGYAITDFAASIISISAVDSNGDYTIQIYCTWTAPTCGHTQHNIAINPLALPSAAGRDDNDLGAWLWRNDQWNWWSPDRIGAGLTWDNVTAGQLDFNVYIKTKTNFTAGQKLYLRIWNSKMTRSWRPVPSNTTFVTF